MAECTSIETLLTNLTNDVAQQKIKIANLESRLSTFATKSDLDNLRGIIEGVRDIAIEARNLIKDLLGNLRQLITEIVLGIIKELLGANKDLEGRVSNLEARVNGIDGIIDRLRNAIDALNGRVSRIEGQLAELRNQIGDILRRLGSVEAIQGQILQDIKNIYNVLSKHQNSIDEINNQIRLIWVAIALLQAQVAGVIIAIANLLKLLKALPSARNGANGRNGNDGRNGRDGQKGDRGENGTNGSNGKDGLNGSKGTNGSNGKDGLNGSNGTNGSNGKDGLNGSKGTNGSNGKDGLNGSKGTNGSNGKDGRNGKNGRDLKMEYSRLIVSTFRACNPNGQGIFASRNIQVIKGTEEQVSVQFEEIAKTRAGFCTSITPDPDGEIFGLIDVTTTDQRFAIPATAQKVVIEFYEIKSFVSKRFSNLNPKYGNDLGTLSFIIDAKQYPDTALEYEKMVLDIPKSYKNSDRAAYIYLEYCKARISFFRAK